MNPPDFLDFLGLCRTHDPGHDEPRSIPDWEYVQKLASALVDHDRLLVVKSRQMMVTWIGCSWLLYRALTGGPGQHLVLSKEERSAKELIERIRFLYEHLPPEISVKQARFRSEGISFAESDSQILSLPATPHAVRGRSPRTVFWDEMAFTPYDEEIWTAVKPAVDSGGRFFGVSTPNGPSGVFARLVHSGATSFQTIHLHYSLNPERDKTWRVSAKSGLSISKWRREQELSFEGAEGRVYDQFDSRTHIINRMSRPGRKKGQRLFRGVDFGYLHPAAVWAVEEPDGGLTIFDCLLGDRWPVQKFAQRILAIDARYGLTEKDFHHTAVDPAGAASTDFGIRPIEALEAAGIRVVHRSSNIAPGVEAVRSLLLDANGEVKLKVHSRCTKLIEAFQSYAWDEEGEVPHKDGIHDHLMDALRYLVINLPRFQRLPLTTTPRVAGLETRKRR